MFFARLRQCWNRVSQGRQKHRPRRAPQRWRPHFEFLEARTVPAISINDVPVLEGDAGTMNAVFDVSLDQVEAVDVTVDFTTQDGTAMTADGDYVLNTGQVVIPAGMLSAPITIVVNGDTTLETDETFSVILSNPMGTTITDDTGIGTITNDENTPPTLANVMATPTMVNENGLATLTGDIVDPDGADTFTLTVDWGDGSALEMFTYPAGTTTFSETHQYVDDAPSGTASDERTIELTLSDDQGGSDTALTTATVENIAPILGAVMVTSPLNEGLVANLTGSFTDPGTLDTFTLTVNWGDGAPVEMFNLPAGATTFSQMHQYRDDGMFPITVTLADDDLGTDMDMTTITVNNLAPTLSMVSVTSPINENGVATLTGAMTDPGTQDAFTLTVTWGDGSVPEVFNFPAGTTTFNQTHLYRDDAPTGTVSDDITINLTLADGDGGMDTDMATVRVNNVAPTMGDIALTPINENGTTTLTGTITDPGTLDTFSLVISWGDGTAAQTVNLGAGSTSFSVTHQFLDDSPTNTASDTITVNVTLTDDDTGSTMGSGMVTISNVAPTVDSGADAGINEGATLMRTGTITDPGTLDTFTGTVDFGDGTAVQTLTINADRTFNLSHQYRDNGTFTVTVTVTDDDTGVATDTFMVTVANLAPTVTIDGPDTGVRGQELTFTLTTTDPSPVDQAGTFTYVITWGDGMTDTVTGPATHTVTHTFAAAGDFTISVTARDKDMATSTADTLDVSIIAFGLVEDPLNPDQMMLVVGGTADADRIHLFRPLGDRRTIKVRMDGDTLGTFDLDDFGRIVLTGQAGSDKLKVGLYVRNEAWIDGGEGDDKVIGGAGTDVLMGGEGSDVIRSHNGRDVVIGGEDRDRLKSHRKEDILIGGTTDFDGDEEALDGIQNEWTSARDYATRIANLDGTGEGDDFDDRLNDDFFLSTDEADETVHDDDARDRLTGLRRRDWFFASTDDRLLDRHEREILNALQSIGNGNLI